jgi:hypothetical protein
MVSVEKFSLSFFIGLNRSRQPGLVKTLKIQNVVANLLIAGRIFRNHMKHKCTPFENPGVAKIFFKIGL